MRDWSRGQVLGHYSIHPSQFNTRMPLHINDDDLCPPTLNVNVHSHITEKPRSEFTMLSYTVHALEIALLLHDSIEMRGALQQTQQEERNERAKTRNHLNKKYEKLVASLPSYFRIGSTVGLTSQGPIPAIPVQRWMLHQQLWSLFLRLNQGSLSSQDGRASYQLLAQHIISTQAQIQARCTVCGSLSASETQLFNAAIVLIIDLLFLSKPKDAGHSIIQLSRLMARDKIREAIELLRTRSNVQYLPSPREPHAERAKASAQRSAFALEALMNLAEEEFGNNEDDSGENCQGGRGIENGTNASASLMSRVMGILEPLQGNASDATAPMEQQANPGSFSGLDIHICLYPLVLMRSKTLMCCQFSPMNGTPFGNSWTFLFLFFLYLLLTRTILSRQRLTFNPSTARYHLHHLRLKSAYKSQGMCIAMLMAVTFHTRPIRAGQVRLPQHLPALMHTLQPNCITA